MKTAQKYLDGYKRLIDSDIESYWVTGKDFKIAINEARKESIEECAKKVETDTSNNFWLEYQKSQKKEILSLIKELK